MHSCQGGRLAKQARPARRKTAIGCTADLHPKRHPPFHCRFTWRRVLKPVHGMLARPHRQPCQLWQYVRGVELAQTTSTHTKGRIAPFYHNFTLRTIDCPEQSQYIDALAAFSYSAVFWAVLG